MGSVRPHVRNKVRPHVSSSASQTRKRKLMGSELLYLKQLGTVFGALTAIHRHSFDCCHIIQMLARRLVNGTGINCRWHITCARNGASIIGATSVAYPVAICSVTRVEHLCPSVTESHDLKRQVWDWITSVRDLPCVDCSKFRIECSCEIGIANSRLSEGVLLDQLYPSFFKSNIAMEASAAPKLCPVILNLDPLVQPIAFKFSFKSCAIDA